MKFDDAVLDLEDEFLGEPQMVGDDVFLDLDFADAVPAEAAGRTRCRRTFSADRICTSDSG